MSRMVLLPAFTDTVRVLVTHVLQAPVPSNDGVCTVDPLTIRLAGRAVVVPLANRTATVAVPAAATFTVNCAWAPVALLALQNPEPEYPDQFESIVPVQTAGLLSASYRVGAACAAGWESTTSAPVKRLAHAMTGFRRMIVSWICASWDGGRRRSPAGAGTVACVPPFPRRSACYRQVMSVSGL